MFAVTSPCNPRPAHAPNAPPHLQRSFGTADLRFRMRDGATDIHRAYRDGAMQMRFPAVGPGEPPEIALLNMAGGLTGGDRLTLTALLEPGSHAVVTAQAFEKVYRSSDGEARSSAHIRLEAGARLDWLFQPAILFDGARFRRETRVDMAADASLLAFDAVVFGRTAMGETMHEGALSESWRILRAGQLIHADTFALDGDMSRMLGRASVLGENRTMACLRYVAPDAEARLAEMRELLSGAACRCAATAWDGILLVRFAAPDGYALYRDVIHVFDGFRDRPRPRLWSL